MIKEMIVVAYSNKKNRLAMILMRKDSEALPAGSRTPFGTPGDVLVHDSGEECQPAFLGSEVFYS